MKIENYALKYMKGTYPDAPSYSVRKLSCDKDISQRAITFLPLYAMILGNINLLSNHHHIKTALMFEDMQNGECTNNEQYAKFINSFESFNKRNAKKSDLKIKFAKIIKKTLKEQSISSYELNIKYGVNLKIYTQIVNARPVSASAKYLKDLYLKIDPKGSFLYM